MMKGAYSMLFNLLGGKKDTKKPEINKRVSVISSYPDQIKLDHESEDEIDVILGEGIKNSKYASEVTGVHLKD